MSYRYHPGKPTESEIKRIIIERFNRSLEELNDKDKGPDKANHQMRKNMKKVRGAVRLVRDAVGEDDYKEYNVAARDTARMGENLRESHVMLETLEKLKKRFNWKINHGFYQKVYRKIESDYLKTKKELLEKEDLIHKLNDRLKDLKADFEDISYRENDFEAFEGGLKRVYKRGRKALKIAKKKPTFENHHEWRKRVKYLWYQIRILKDIWSKELNGYAKELHNLSDLLGDDHDLYDLQKKLNAEYDTVEHKAELENLNALIKEFSNEKRKDAYVLGEKIYAEKPKAFVKRMEKYWKATHSLVEK